MTDGWYLLRGDIQYGPFTSAQILECVATQKITHADLLRREETMDWRAAERFPELFLDPTLPLHVDDRPRIAYANFGSRLIAKMIDDASYLFAYVMIVGLVEMQFFPENTGFRKNVNICIFFTGYWLYRALMMSSRDRATLGKLAMAVKVTDLAGNRISFGRATIRHLAECLSFVTVFGYLLAAMTEKGQTLHDMIAGTLVVKKYADF